MKKSFFIIMALFFSFLGIANAQNSALTRPVFYAPPTDSAFYDSLNAEYGSVEFGDLMKMNNYGWIRYKAGWDWRLRWTRAMLRGLFGVDSATADSIAKDWLKKHPSMEEGVYTLFAGMRKSLINLKAGVDQTRRDVRQNSQDIRSLAEGFLAQHGKGVKDRRQKKKLTLQRIAEIVSRNRPQGDGQ